MIGGFHRALTITIYSDALIPGLCKVGEYLCYSLAPEAVTGLYHVHILHFFNIAQTVLHFTKSIYYSPTNRAFCPLLIIF